MSTQQKGIVAKRQQPHSPPAVQTQPASPVHVLNLPPQQMVKAITEIANLLNEIIIKQNLSVKIQREDYVTVEGWTTLASLLGVTAKEVSVMDNKDGSYTAVYEICKLNGDTVLGRASAMCGKDEPFWRNKPAHQRRSMACTRAVGKCYRTNFSWIMKLAGFQPTPAEEMEDFVVASKNQPKNISPAAEKETPEHYDKDNLDHMDRLEKYLKAANMPIHLYQIVSDRMHKQPLSNLKKVVNDILQANARISSEDQEDKKEKLVEVF